MNNNTTNNDSEATINSLFGKWEKLAKWSDQLNFKSMYGDEEMLDSYNLVFSEVLEEIRQTQVRLIRAFLKAGMVGELLMHVEVGTLPKYSIQCAFGRRPQGVVG